jgi:hypothetical protein
MPTTPALYTVAALVKKFGPFKCIDRKREDALYKEGRGAHIFTITSEDMEWKDMAEDDRPTLDELVDMGYTREDYTEPRYYGQSGSRMVNKHEIYESTKPMPEGIEVGPDAEWYDDGTLPTP